MLRATLLLSTLVLASLTAHAADDKPAQLPPVKPGWSLLPEDVPDAKVEEIVTEDDHTRVDEIRVRGQVKKVTVHLKDSPLPDYEILLKDARFNMSGARNSPVITDGVAGIRVWNVLDF